MAVAVAVTGSVPVAVSWGPSNFPLVRWDRPVSQRTVAVGRSNHVDRLDLVGARDRFH